MNKYLGMGLIAVLTSGCGELSYKRGASANDLEIAKQSCQSAGNEKAVSKCLEDQGWVVQNLGDMDLFAVASASSDSRSPAAPLVLDVAEKRVVGSTDNKEKTASVGQQRSQTATAAETRQINTPPLPTSPLDVYTVSSWWKLGAGREAMEANTTECVEKLGAAHQPNHKNQQVTRGFVICMHEKGWKALRALG